MLRWAVYIACALALLNLPAVEAVNCAASADAVACGAQSANGCSWMGTYCACRRAAGDQCSADTPLTAAEKDARDKMNVKAGMRAGWVPFSFFLFGACMMAGAWSAGGGKADGLLGVAQILAVVTFVLCFFLLLNPNWVQAGWLMFCCPFIILACGLNNYKLLQLTSFVVLFNFMNMLGFWGNVAWIFPTWQYQTGAATLTKMTTNFLDVFAAQDEASCMNYYLWFEKVVSANVWDKQSYSMCARNKFVGFLIWNSMFVILLQPMILLCQFVSLGDADKGQAAPKSQGQTKQEMEMS